MKPTAWSTGKPAFAVRGPYRADTWLSRHYLLGYVAMAIVAGGFGYAFATFGAPYGQYIPFAAPLAALAAMLFWVMPEVRNPPLKWLDRLFVVFLFALLAWPDYVAVVLPGLPWITAVRLIGIPLAIVLMIAVFGSRSYRAQMSEYLTGDKVVVRLLVTFMVIAGLSILLSHDKASSANRYFVALMSWFAVFFAACGYFAKPGRPQKFSIYLFVILLLCLAITAYEVRHNQLPWAGRLPKFLNADNPLVTSLLAGSVRVATGTYRVQSKFATSIGLGEFMAMVFPFLLHLLVYSRRLLLRAAVLTVIPVMFYIVLKTDSRLAFIGFCLTIALYSAAAALLRWKNFRDSLIAPAILVSYPVFLAAFVALSLIWRKLFVMIWGGGAQQLSTQSRADQLRMGIPKILHNPFGYGIGQGAPTLGYVAPGSGRVTIDSYYLSTALEFGVIGFVIFYGMFLWAAWRAANAAFNTRDPDILFLVPATVALTNFLVSKSIYSQTENHPLAYMLLGMIVALLYRHRLEKAGAQVSPK